MKALFICCLLVGIHISSFSQQAAVFNKPKYEKAAQALGFLEGQELQLARVQQDFPELSSHVQLVKSEFSSAFGQAHHHIVRYLKDYYGDHYTTFEQSLQKGLRETLDQMRIKDRMSAETYIAEVKKRAMGEISAPVLEILLAYQYLAFPTEEFSAGMTNTFRTKGHLKAKGGGYPKSGHLFFFKVATFFAPKCPVRFALKCSVG